MFKIVLPFSRRQLAYLALAVLAPLVLAAGAIVWASPKPGGAVSGEATASIVVAVMGVGVTGIVAAAANRRAIEIAPDLSGVRDDGHAPAPGRAGEASVTAQAPSSAGGPGSGGRHDGNGKFDYGAHGTCVPAPGAWKGPGSRAAGTA